MRIWGRCRLRSFSVLDHVGPLLRTPALRAAVDVGIDGKCGMVKGLGHHDRGCFMADAGERFQRFKTFRDFALVFLDQDLGELPDRLSL